MSPETVAIIFASRPNFDELAFKYLLLSLNNIQNQYEFVFPGVHQYYYFNNHYETDALFEEFQEEIKPNISSDSSPIYYINIITSSMGNNLFFESRGRTSFITTDTWEKYFSPPSLFEYLTHCIMASLIFMNPKLNLGSHHDTRGCILDYTFYKMDDKVDIVLGQICHSCKTEIISHAGETYFNEVTKVINRHWIGDVNVFGTIAYNLKKYFSFNIDQDSGFNKNFWEKAKEHFPEIPKEIIVLFVGAIIGAIITYLASCDIKPQDSATYATHNCDYMGETSIPEKTKDVLQ